MATDFKSNMNLEKHFIPILNHSRICNFYPKETFSSSSSIRFRFGFGLDFNTWTIFLLIWKLKGTWEKNATFKWKKNQNFDWKKLDKFTIYTSNIKKLDSSLMDFWVPITVEYINNWKERKSQLFRINICLFF